MAKRDYWRERAEADMDVVQDAAGKRLDRIGRAYHKAAHDLTQEVEKIIGTYAKRFNLTRDEALARLKEPYKGGALAPTSERGQAAGLRSRVAATRSGAAAVDEDSRAYSYRMSREDALRESARVQAQRLGAVVNDETDKQRRYTAQEGYRRARRALNERVGAGVSFASPDVPGLLGSIGTCWAGKSYSERIWQNTSKLADTLREEVTAAYLSGKSNAAIEQVIMNRFGVGFREAERLVRTETSYVANKAALRSYGDAGLEEYEFLTAKDSRTCKVCAGMDGKQFAIKDQQVGVNAPPMHPFCRCTVLPVVENALDGLTDEETRQWVKDGAPEDVEGWLKKTRGDDIILYGEPVHVSIGAKSRTEPNVANPLTGQYDIEFVRGSRPVYPSDHLLAGKGSKHPIKKIDQIVDEYGGDPREWKHEKAYYQAYDPTGDIREIEIHWFEEPDVGRAEEEIQLRDGRMYRDEWTETDLRGGIRKR